MSSRTTSKLNYSWTPRLDSKQRLVGPLPTVLDFRTRPFPHTDVFSHDSKAFAVAGTNGDVVQPNAAITDSDSIEVLYLPSDAIGLSYVVIENLPNLRELYVCKTQDQNLHRYELKWLICRNLPSLKRVVVVGDLVWIDLHDVTALTHVNATECKTLDHFSIVNAPVLTRVNLRGCVKLRKVEGLAGDDQKRLGITTQIQGMQAKSRRDRKLYKNMTHTDVDLVLDAINEGIKAACRRGDYILDTCNVLGRCDGKEHDSTFKPFKFQILRPLEAVYTGGTGETYPYEFLKVGYDWDIRTEWYPHSIGNSSQEMCLRYALKYEGMNELLFQLYKRPKPTDRQLLQYFEKAATSVPYDYCGSRTVRFDAKAALKKDEIAAYERRLKSLGFRVAPRRSANVDLWVVYDPNDERMLSLCKGRNVLVDELGLEYFVAEMEKLVALRTGIPS